MIRVFPRRTKWTPDDELAFVGAPPLFRPENQPVRISITFTWDINEGKRLADMWSKYYSDVQLGGPAFDDPGNEFEPGKFIKEGVTITSRGCPKRCPWCFVPKREGYIREIKIKPGWIIQDNNLLACGRKHIEAVFDMLREQKKAVKFSGGLDVEIFSEWHRRLIDTIKIYELWFACDTKQCLSKLAQVAEILNGISINKRRCYVMIGYGGEGVDEAERKLNKVYELGFLPFAQLYQNSRKIKYSPAWNTLAREWSRPAIYRREK
jgi:hypothetical protein